MPPNIGPGTAASFMNLGGAGRQRVFTGLKEFQQYLRLCAAEEPIKLLACASAVAAVTKASIQKVFGDSSILAPNTETTQDLRSDEGAGGPLYIDGTTLRASIEARAEPDGSGALAGVGSASQILVWQEHGYTTAPDSMIPNKIVPPRPAFSAGVYMAMPICQKIVSRFALPGLEWRNMAGEYANLLKPEAAIGGVLKGAGDMRDIARGQMPYQTGAEHETGVFLGE